MILSVSPEAEQELTDGAVFYAREANAELGLAWRGTIRRMLLRRLPYSVMHSDGVSPLS